MLSTKQKLNRTQALIRKLERLPVVTTQTKQHPRIEKAVKLFLKARDELRILERGYKRQLGDQ